MVGAGGLAETWSKKVLAEARAELVAVVDPLIGTDRQSPWLSNIAEIPRFRDLASMTTEADAILVTAFSTAHASIIRDALPRGLHVLVEKPFTTTMADAEELVALAEARRLTLMVSQNYRFFPGSALVRDLVRTRRFGGIAAIFGEFWCDWPGKPYQHGMQHVMGLEMAVHHFDMARAIFESEAVGGTVREWQPAACRYASGGAVEALFDMADPHGSFPFTYSGSLVGKAPLTPWPGLWRFEFDKETVVVDTVDGRYGTYRAHAGGFDWLGPFWDDMVFELPLAHFIESVRSGREPWCSGRDNLGTLKMALGAETFGRRG
jgi:predicted dehydrogenase